MTSRVCVCILLVGLASLGLTACDGDAETNTGENAVVQDESSMAAGGEEISEPVTEDEEATPEGRISSGAFQLKPTPTFRTRPEAPVGQRRIVSLEQAIAGATFQLLEPKELPEESYRDVVHLETAVEGETDPALPAVRFVYTLSNGGALIMFQHPATGEEGPGEPVDIAGISGWAADDEAPVVTWEQDGVRIELRGKDVDLDLVLAAARSVGPLTPEE